MVRPASSKWQSLMALPFGLTVPARVAVPAVTDEAAALVTTGLGAAQVKGTAAGGPTAVLLGAAGDRPCAAGGTPEKPRPPRARPAVAMRSLLGSMTVVLPAPPPPPP